MPLPRFEPGTVHSNWFWDTLDRSATMPTWNSDLLNLDNLNIGTLSQLYKVVKYQYCKIKQALNEGRLLKKINKSV